MILSHACRSASATSLKERNQIPDRFKWDLAGIFPDWNAWQTAYDELDQRIQAFAGLEGSLAKGPDRIWRRSSFATRSDS